MRREDGTSKGRWVVDIDGHAAEMTCSRGFCHRPVYSKPDRSVAASVAPTGSSTSVPVFWAATAPAAPPSKPPITEPLSSSTW